MSQYKSEIKDTLWLTILQSVNYLVPIIIWPYLMVVLGAVGFGRFTFGLSVAQYLILIIDFGFNLSATKKIAMARDNRSEINRIFSATMRAKAYLLGVCLVVIVVLCLIPRFYVYRYVLLVFAVMVMFATFSFIWLYQGIGKMSVVSAVNCIAKISILPITFLLVHEAEDVLLAAAIQAAVFVVSSSVSYIIIRRHKYASFVSVTHAEALTELSDGLPVFISTAATSLYTGLFVVVLACFVMPDEVGIYAAADKIMRCSCNMFFIPLAQAFFPRVSQLSEEDKDRGEHLIVQLLLLMSSLMIAVGLTLFFLAEPICAYFSADYAGIGSIARIIAPVPLLVGIGGICGQEGLLALGDEEEKRTFRRIYLYAALVALVAVVPLTFFFGSIGTAVSVLLTEAFVSVSMVCAYLRKHPNPLRP